MGAERKILVIGLGRFGSSLVRALWENGADVVVLDADEELVERLKDRTSAAYVGDATEQDVLEGIGGGESDVAIVTFGEHFEASVLTIVALAELGVETIIGRAPTPRKAEILKTVGATRVLQLETDMGERLAKELVSPVHEELLAFAQEYQVFPWVARGEIAGKTLAEADLRRRFELNVIGYRPKDDEVPSGARPRLRVPRPGYRIQEGDTLMLVGEEEKVNEFLEAYGE
jgi:trk system potassium uptake protein TrkA